MKNFSLKQFFVGPIQSAIWGCLFLMILSGLVFVASSYGIRKDVESRLFKEYSKIEDQIVNRIQVYANSLLGARAFLYRLSPGNQHLLNSYLQDMQLIERYPGFGGIGYLEILSTPKLIEQSARLNRFVPDFSLNRYLTSNDYHAIVTIIYPDDWINRSVIGRDMFSESLRQKSIMASIAADKPTLSEPVMLRQGSDKSNQQLGFLFFIPIYEITSINTEKTIENTRSVVFMRFAAMDLFSAIFGHQSLAKEKVGFSIESLVDGKNPVKIYDRFEQGSTGKNLITREFNIFGQTFRLSVYPLPDFFTSFDDIIPYLLSSLTLLISALVFLTIRNNSQHATELEKSNKLLEKGLIEQQEKQEDLIILNRTLQQMSHSLEIDNIMKNFMSGVSEIFENKGKFAIYSIEKKKDTVCSLITSNDPTFFVQKAKLTEKHYAELLLMMEQSEEQAKTPSNCNFLVSDQSENYVGLCSKLDASPFGSNAVVVFVSTAGNKFHEMEAILFQALMQHFETSIQNSLLLKRVEDANQSKTAFLANMSHEIRTPLNAIMGFSEILIRDDVNRDIKKELSGSIIKNGKQLSRLVDDILDLSKIEAGKILIDKRRINIFEVLEEIKRVMAVRITGKDVEFKIEIDGKIPTYLSTDSIRLKQIMMNLIGNSIKFTQKGLVRLRVSHHVVDGKKHMMYFRVEDTGCGMDREFKDRIFQPFSQADSSATRTFGGTGLGLAISKRLARDLGGNLTLIFSERDMGSIFEVTIPLTDYDDQIWTDTVPMIGSDDDHEITPPEIKLPDKNILLVEDSLDNQDFFNFYLSMSGAIVKTVPSGIEAVEEVKNNSYDLILMDIQLPGIDGKEATKQIRKLGFRGPIIALTAHAMAEEQESCLKAGFNGQISKPVGGQFFISQVYNYIHMRENNAITT